MNKASSELNLRRWEEQNVEARSEATLRVNERGRAKEALSAIHYHLPMHCTLRYGTLLMVPEAKLSYNLRLTGARDRMVP